MLINRIEVVDILSESSNVKRYYDYFKIHGFDIKRDLKKFNISIKEYQKVLNDLSKPNYFTNPKGCLQANDDNTLIVKKLYVSYRNQSKRDGLRVIALIIIVNVGNKIYILPFHMYSKNKKSDLTQLEENLLKKILVDLDFKGGKNEY